MKKILFLSLIFISKSFFAQSTRMIVKDFDGDLKKDTVRIDSNARILICLLSSQKFKKIQSGEIQRLNFGNTLVPTSNGFEFWNDFERSGFRCVFEYNKEERKIQLIRMRRVDDILSIRYGHKFKGFSEVNLTTNKYVGNFYQVCNKKVVKIPTINSEMIFTKTYLETFNDVVCFDYETKCVMLYNKNKCK